MELERHPVYHFLEGPLYALLKLAAICVPVLYWYVGDPPGSAIVLLLGVVIILLKIVNWIFWQKTRIPGFGVVRTPRFGPGSPNYEFPSASSLPEPVTPQAIAENTRRDTAEIQRVEHTTREAIRTTRRQEVQDAREYHDSLTKRYSGTKRKHTEQDRVIIKYIK